MHVDPKIMAFRLDLVLVDPAGYNLGSESTLGRPSKKEA
jgi:hypothetical protein